MACCGQAQTAGEAFAAAPFLSTESVFLTFLYSCFGQCLVGFWTVCGHTELNDVGVIGVWVSSQTLFLTEETYLELRCTGTSSARPTLLSQVRD